MIKLLFIIFSVVLVSCQTTQQTTAVNYHNSADYQPSLERPIDYQVIDISSDAHVWVSNSYREIETNTDGMSLYISENNPPLSEFYLVVNTSSNYPNDLITENRADWVEVSKSNVTVSNIEYSNSISYFNALNTSNEGYQDSARKTYSPRSKCGLVSEFSPKEEHNYTILFVDAIHCDDLMLALKKQEMLKPLHPKSQDLSLRSIESLDKRIETLRTEELKSFGFL